MGDQLVYVIIVTYNSEKWIEKCFLSLKKQNLLSHTIVVDNNSNDKTVSVLQTTYPEVILIKNTENQGFAKANNQGIQFAYDKGAQYFFLLNHDTWLKSENVIQNLVDVLYQNPNLGIVSPIHLNGEENLLEYHFNNGVSGSYDEGRTYYSDLIIGKQPKPYYWVYFINAAAWLISRKCIETVGLFDDEMFPHYGEDNNYLYRIRVHNLQLAFVPNVYICHDTEARQGDLNKVNKFSQHEELRAFKTNALNPLESNENILSQQVSAHFLQVLKNALLLKISTAKQHLELYEQKKEVIDLVPERKKAYRAHGFNLQK